MAELFEIYRKRTFTKNEAARVAAVAEQVTDRVVGEVEELQAEIAFLPESAKSLRKNIQERLESLHCEWVQKMRALGGSPKAMWTVDFDCGDGFFCWHHGDAIPGSFKSYEHEMDQRRP